MTASAPSSTALAGALWSAYRGSGVYIVSVRDRASIADALADFVASQDIRAGQITGVGATNHAVLRFFDPATKAYVDKAFTEQMEIANLSGNIASVRGKLILHMHVTLGRRDNVALAGHLLDAQIRGAGEFFIYPVDADIVKVPDPAVGLNFYNFSG